MKLTLCIFLTLFPFLLFSNDFIENETIINETIFLDKFLLKKNYLSPSKDLRLLGYTEKQRLNQVNKKLEILSHLVIDSRDDRPSDRFENFFIKTPASGVIKNLNLDPRWLEVNPKHNPILRKNDRLVLHNLNSQN